MIGGDVGLVSGACFAEFGNNVAVVESDPGELASLNAGQMPIYEPGLDALEADNVRAARLTVRANLRAMVRGVESVFMAAGAPSGHGDLHANPAHLYRAAERVGVALGDYVETVTRSTAPVINDRRCHRAEPALLQHNPLEATGYQLQRCRGNQAQLAIFPGGCFWPQRRHNRCCNAMQMPEVYRDR